MGLSLLHPGLFIAGLLCIAIPILVHLLRRKYRPVTWGAMRFLEQAYKKRRRLITIQQLLLLITRCALIACIAAAVGAIVIGSRISGQQSKTIAIIIDNSIHSAERLTSGQSSLEYQQSRALELLSTLDPSRGDRAALITAAAPARGDAIPATGELGLIRSRIESLSPTDADRDLAGAMQLVESLLTSEDETETSQVILPYAFLSNGGWTQQAAIGSLNELTFESLWIDSPSAIDRASANSISIKSVTPLRPIVTQADISSLSTQDEIQGVRVQLTRSSVQSNQQVTVRVTDPVREELLASQSFDWPSSQTSITRSIPIDAAKLIPARGGSAIVRVALADPVNDNNPLDNSRVVGLPIRQHLNIGIIDSFAIESSTSFRPSRWVRAVFGADDELISMQLINAVSAGDRIDPTLDVLYVLSPSKLDERAWDRIDRLNLAGMPIIVSADEDLQSLYWTQQLSVIAPSLFDNQVQVRSLDAPIGLEQELASDGSGMLNGIQSEYTELASSIRISRQLLFQAGQQADVHISDTQGNPVLLSTRNSSSINQSLQATTENTASARGQVVLLALALNQEWTDLPAKPLFVALMHEMMRSLVAQSIAPIHIIAGSEAAGFDQQQLDTLIESQSSDPRRAGVFALLDQYGTTRQTLILNPDATSTVLAESDQQSAIDVISRSSDTLDIQQLDASVQVSLSSSAGNGSDGRTIAFWFFGFALALAVAELMLARRCSYTAPVVPTARARGWE